MAEDKIGPLLGLVGILVAALGAEFNDQVVSLSLPDILGGLSLGHDPGTWVESLYVTGEIIGLCLSPWFFITFTVRRFSLFVIAANALVTVLIPSSPDDTALFVLRFLQGLFGGMTVPILLAAALKGLPPAIRLYGLAAYALTATFTPNFAATLAALWTHAVDWRFAFYEAIPFFALAAALVWWGLPQDGPKYERFRIFDWRGFAGLVLGFGAFSTMLQQGNRLDWFNSPLISILALASVVVIPLFFLNEWFHPLPFLKLQLLGRRNIAYGVVALFAFLIIASSSSLIPASDLADVEGFRPLQIYGVTLVIALIQIVMLPAVAFLLDFERVDGRVVTLVGLVLVLTACVGDSYLTVSWKNGQFLLWQVLQAFGQPMVVMPLLMLATNAVTRPAEEGPFVSALVNTTRGIAEAVGVWLVDLIQRWRGTFHTQRLIDQVGLDRLRLDRVLGAGTAFPRDGMPGMAGGLDALARDVERQAAILTTSDVFLVLAAIVIGLMVVVVFLPQRTPPPRLLPPPPHEG